MSEEHRPWREQIGSLLLGHLTPEEEAGLRGHLDGCPECRREAEELGAVAAALAAADLEHVIAPPQPPPGLEESVFARLREARRVGASRRRRRWGVRVAAGLAAAAVVVGAFIVIGGEEEPRLPAVERVAFASLPQGAEAVAELRRVPEGIEVDLLVRGIPDGEWVIGLERADGSVEEAETFHAPSGSWHGRRTLPIGREEAVAIHVRRVEGGTELVAPLPDVA